MVIVAANRRLYCLWEEDKFILALFLQHFGWTKHCVSEILLRILIVVDIIVPVYGGISWGNQDNFSSETVSHQLDLQRLISTTSSSARLVIKPLVLTDLQELLSKPTPASPHPPINTPLTTTGSLTQDQVSFVSSVRNNVCWICLKLLFSAELLYHNMISSNRWLVWND